MHCLFRLFLLLGCCWVGFPVFAQPADPGGVGRSIYEKGIGRDGREIVATVHGSVTLKGNAIACGGCHGENARGGGEAFVQAPDIRWLNLSKTYSARRSGSTGNSYNQSSFSAALRSGIAASGKKLDPVMPRFDLADDEIKGLIAYLGEIDAKYEHTPPRLSILGLLPKPGRNALADALAFKLKNCPASEKGDPVSAIDIVYFDSPDDAMAQLGARIRESGATVVLAPYIAGWEDRYARGVRSGNVQTILPFTFLDRIDSAQWYYTFPGVEAQILALIKSIRADGHTRLHIQYEPGDPLSARLHAFAREMAQSYGLDALPEFLAGIPSLWLKSVDSNRKNELTSVPGLNLAPAMFFASIQFAAESMDNSARATWRVAYPYKPQSNTGGIWRTPVTAWAQAACAFLAQVGGGIIDPGNLPGVLQWEEGGYLLKDQSLDQLADQVSIDRDALPKRERR